MVFKQECFKKMLKLFYKITMLKISMGNFIYSLQKNSNRFCVPKVDTVEIVKEFDKFLSS